VFFLDFSLYRTYQDLENQTLARPFSVLIQRGCGTREFQSDKTEH